MSRQGVTATVAALGTAQTLAWASSYYLPAILAVPMGRDLGVSTPTVFAVFSLALILSALLGPSAGRAIDRWGGRPILMVSSLIFAVGLGVLAMAQGPLGLAVAWLILGIGMGSGLYEVAFASLVRLYGRDSRSVIIGITLIAGFASTVGWPLTAWLEAEIGWRGACWTWAIMHLLMGLPLNAAMPKMQPPSVAPAEVATKVGGIYSAGRSMWLLAFVFAVTGFINTAMAAHLPRVLQAGGADLAVAVAIGALVGPAQVAGRLLELGVLRNVHPLLSARLATLMHPFGATLFALFGTSMSAGFALLHGAGNGMLTIAKGTLPLALFGPAGYGQRQGLLMVPTRIAQALAPWVFGLCLDRYGDNAMWISAAIGFAAFIALIMLGESARLTHTAKE